ncbi:hypothetical protein BC940DRAFT_96748 [Gongronella butleri]|nr:hypothetical protein BC940DRAFT_96748 [Gongronella butleri]
MYVIFFLLAALTSLAVEAANLILPVNGLLVIAGTSVLTTWSLGNATAANLYVAVGTSATNNSIISIVGQNLTQTSIMANIPKDAPNDNTMLLLVGNDNTQDSRGLTVTFGGSTVPSSVTTAPPTSNVTSMSSTSMPSSTGSSTTSSSSSDSSQTQSATNTPAPDSNDLSSGAIAGIAAGGAIAGIGLLTMAILFLRRRSRAKREKRHTELFDDTTGSQLDAPYADAPYAPSHNAASSAHHHYGASPMMAATASPFDTYGDSSASAVSYSRSMAHTQAPVGGVFASAAPYPPSQGMATEMTMNPTYASSRTELPTGVNRTQVDDSNKHDPFASDAPLPLSPAASAGGMKPDEVDAPASQPETHTDKPHEKS